MNKLPDRLHGLEPNASRMLTGLGEVRRRRRAKASGVAAGAAALSVIASVGTLALAGTSAAPDRLVPAQPPTAATALAVPSPETVDEVVPRGGDASAPSAGSTADRAEAAAGAPGSRPGRESDDASGAERPTAVRPAALPTVRRMMVDYEAAATCERVDREWSTTGWCHVYRGPMRLVRGQSATLALDLCRTGAAAGGRGELRFPTTRQGAFAVRSGDRELWSSNDAPSTFRAGERLAIQAGTCARWTLPWDGRDRQGRLLPPGTYRLLLATNGDEQSASGRPYAGSVDLAVV